MSSSNSRKAPSSRHNTYTKYFFFIRKVIAVFISLRLQTPEISFCLFFCELFSRSSARQEGRSSPQVERSFLLYICFRDDVLRFTLKAYICNVKVAEFYSASLSFTRNKCDIQLYLITWHIILKNSGRIYTSCWTLFITSCVNMIKSVA